MLKLKDLLMEIEDDQMIKYKDADGESQEMKAGSAKTMGKDHPAKIEYEKQKDGDGDAKKGVNIFDKPADEPKAQSSNGDDRQIGGPNGLEIDRDERYEKEGKGREQLKMRMPQLRLVHDQFLFASCIRSMRWHMKSNNIYC